MTLWILMGLLIVAVAAALLMPAFLSADAEAPRADYDVNVYKDQLAELDREAAEGRIADADLAAARLEIQRRLLAAADSDEENRRPVARWPLLAAAVVPAIGAVVVYLQLGQPTVPDYPLAARPVPANDQTADGAAAEGEGNLALSAMVAALQKRLDEAPEDPQGWILLGRSYATLGRLEPASSAFAKATELTNRDPAVLADWAEMRLMQSGGAFNETIFNDFVEARQGDPSLPKPWFYIGLDRAQAGDFKDAAQIWTDLLFISPEDASFADAVREKIDAAAKDGGFEIGSITPSPVAQQVAEAIAKVQADRAAAEAKAPPGPSQADVNAASEMSAEDRDAFIRSMVERLAAKLEAQPNDPDGWQRLIRAYEVLGETEKAADARQRLGALGTIQ